MGSSVECSFVFHRDTPAGHSKASRTTRRGGESDEDEATHSPDRPDIRLETVRFSQDHLRRRVLDGPRGILYKLVRSTEQGTDSKIGNHERRVGFGGTVKNVFRFDVAVYDLPAVYVFHPGEDLSKVSNGEIG